MEYLFYYFKRLRAYSGRILYVNLLGTVLVSFLQGMENLLLIPLISIAGIAGVQSQATILNIFEFLHFPKTVGLPYVLCIYILLVTGQSLLQRNINIRNQRIQSGFLFHLKRELHRSILLTKWEFFLTRKQSDIINTLMTDFARVGSGLVQFLEIISSLIFTLIQIVVALLLSAKMTVFVLVCGLIHTALTRSFARKIKLLGNLTSELAKSFMSGMMDQLNGIKDIKSNSLEKSRLAWVSFITQKMESEQMEYIRLRTTSEVLTKLSSAIFLSLFIFFSVQVFHGEIGELMLITVIFFRLWPRIAGIQFSINNIAANIPAFKDLIQLEKDSKAAQELTERDHLANIKRISLQQGIECQKVYFRYNQKEVRYALQDINLPIPANHMTAIVGRSGAGKSTLVDILMGLIKPVSGQVLIDGQPLDSSNILALRRSISYVPQDPFLFNVSIRENLLLVEPNASDEDCWEALESSALAEFVRGLPMGLDSVIGDRGIRLSGGERQRLVLARAILRKPSIIILDEATSSLDTENERKVQEVLDKLKGTMTIIVIAHRLSTIRNADQVIVLDQGRVIQRGRFAQLALDKKGLFSRLLSYQLMKVNVMGNDVGLEVSSS